MRRSSGHFADTRTCNEPIHLLPILQPLYTRTRRSRLEPVLFNRNPQPGPPGFAISRGGGAYSEIVE